MARNSSGNHSLPSGNPVTSGSTISSTVHNNTLSDISSEITDSLSRSGKGAMLAPLEATDGSAAAPSITFDSDPDTGLYRIGANNLGVAVAGAKVVDVAAGTVGVTGTVTATAGVTATQSTADGAGGTFTGGASNGKGIVTTGDGTGAGIQATGGDDSGSGVVAQGGASNGKGILATGDGSGAGIQATGGDSHGKGGVFVGGATDGDGLSATGTGTGIGGIFNAGTASTGAAPTVAVELQNGHLKFNGVTNPNSTAGVTNTVTPLNIVKGWGLFNTDAGGNVAVSGGFNVASASVASNDLVITWADDFASGTYCVVAITSSATLAVACTARAAGTATLRVFNTTTAAAQNLNSVAVALHVIAIGAQ